MPEHDEYSDVPVDKSILRKHYIGIRKGLRYQLRNEKSLAILSQLKGIPEMARPRHIFSYISYGFEPDTHLLIDWLQQNSIKVSVPIIVADGKISAVRFPGWDHIVAGPRNVPQPDSTETVDEDIDICITPALSFTESGYRLGYGAGYYDRWFNAHDVPVKIGLAYEETIAPELPVQAHDIPVDIVITENRVIRVR